MIGSVEQRIKKSNLALRELKNRISNNSDVTKKFLEDVIRDVQGITKPNIDDLRAVYNYHTNNLK